MWIERAIEPESTIYRERAMLHERARIAERAIRSESAMLRERATPAGEYHDARASHRD